MNRYCIILAGGFGTRLRAVTGDLPKCLAPIGGIPFIIRQMAGLADQGFNRFVLALGVGAGAVVDCVSRVKTKYEIINIVEPHALGTGGAILNALNCTGLAEAVVINGDTYLTADLSPMFFSLDTANDELVRIAGIRVDDRQRFGGVEVDGRWVSEFIEKGVSGSGLINSGCYRVGINAFNGILPNTKLSFEDQVLYPLVQKRQVGFVSISGEMIDIGVPSDYWKMNIRYS